MVSRTDTEEPSFATVPATMSPRARKTLYAAHRWIGLAVSVQLLAWSVGGFMFSVLALDDVHGDRERRRGEVLPIEGCDLVVSASEAIDRARQAGVAPPVRVVLGRRLGRIVYETYDDDGEATAVVDAGTGEVTLRISNDEAVQAARADFAPEAAVRSVRLVTADPPIEYRGKPLPAYEVIFDHPKEPHLFVSAVTGEILARRNRPWRLFDFFYMLHVMDYRQREDFNHWLLTLFSALAVLTAASGLSLHVWRLVLGRARRNSLPPRRA